jgi:Flp pilus assembly pilin Flp
VHFLKYSFSGIRLFIHSRCGATAIEYALMASAIALAIATLVFALGDEVNALMSGVIGMLTPH